MKNPLRKSQQNAPTPSSLALQKCKTTAQLLSFKIDATFVCFSWSNQMKNVIRFFKSVKISALHLFTSIAFNITTLFISLYLTTGRWITKPPWSFPRTLYPFFHLSWIYLASWTDQAALQWLLTRLCKLLSIASPLPFIALTASFTCHSIACVAIKTGRKRRDNSI